LLGIHGVVSFAVCQRSKEMGIRAAIGASRAMLFRMVVRAGARPILLGIGVGVPAAILGTRTVATLLRNAPVAADSSDPAAYVAVALLLLLAGIGAMARPAWRAATVDPVQALREE
jgi:ABC-type antimicrobial peptide transport system permease subunit